MGVSGNGGVDSAAHEPPSLVGFQLIRLCRYVGSC